MNRLCRVGFVALLFFAGVSSIAQAASAGGRCKTVGRRVVSSGVSLRCTKTKSGLKWRLITPPLKSSQPAATTAPVVVTPSVSVEPTLLRQSGVIFVTSNVVGTVYVAEVSVKVARVEDIQNAGKYLWVSAPIINVGVNEISVDINGIVNGNYRVYVANGKGVLSAASLNMVVVSMTRSDESAAVSMPGSDESVAAQSWQSQFGTSLFDEDGPAVAVDGSGNVYVVATVSAEGPIKIIVNKFDSLGIQVAYTEFGTNGLARATSIAVDVLGNVYVAGDTYGSFDGYENLGFSDGFVAKFNSSLVLQGTVKQLVTTANVFGCSIAVDASGNVYVAGQTFGTLDGVLISIAFVAKFNSQLDLPGTVNLFGTTGDDNASSIAVDASGNVYVAGSTSGAFTDGGNLGFGDGFVAKFNSSLELQGAVKQFGTAADDYAYSIAVDASGNVYVAGETGGAFTVAGNLGFSDGFVAKFNSSLELQGTVKQFGTNGDDNATSIAVDVLGNVYVAGDTYGSFDGYENLGLSDGFGVKFDSSLDLQGTVKQFGTTGNEYAYSIAVDASGNVYVAGMTDGDLFGPNSGGYDAFVMKEVA